MDDWTVVNGGSSPEVVLFLVLNLLKEVQEIKAAEAEEEQPSLKEWLTEHPVPVIKINLNILPDPVIKLSLNISPDNSPVSGAPDVASSTIR